MRLSREFEDYLEHTLKGSSRPGHKYISRAMKNGKWAYKYARDKAANIAKASTKSDLTLSDGTNVSFDDVQLVKSNSPVDRDNSMFIDYKNGKVSREYVLERTGNENSSYTTEEAERRLKAIDDQKKRQARRQEAIKSKKTAEVKAQARKTADKLKEMGFLK